jgi:hypothetical protein
MSAHLPTLDSRSNSSMPITTARVQPRREHKSVRQSGDPIIRRRRSIKILTKPSAKVLCCSYCQCSYDVKSSNAWDKRYYCSKACQRAQISYSDLQSSAEAIRQVKAKRGR